VGVDGGNVEMSAEVLKLTEEILRCQRKILESTVEMLRCRQECES